MTREDVQRAAAAGAALQVPAGAIVTDLAREEAASQGVAILPAAPPARQRAPPGRPPRPSAAPPARARPGTRAARKEPAVYSRDAHDVAGSTAEMIARLDAFTELVWRSEPNEVRRLRQLSRPPMGQLPGIFYACFNLFWLGEEVQTLRDKAKAGAYPVAVLNDLLGTLCARHSRPPLQVVPGRLAGAARRRPAVPRGARLRQPRRVPRSSRESLLVAIDRIQAWVDRMIPWHTLDANLELVP